MRYDFIVETYDTERIKVLSLWSMFADQDLRCRPHAEDSRGRSVLEQMVHQCVSEDLWLRTMLGVDVGAPPLPEAETRIDFIKRYSEDSLKRLDVLRSKPEGWWEETVGFFDVKRTRAWVMMRRIAHCPPQGTADGHAANVKSQLAQHLWSDSGHRRINAEPCADDLRLFWGI